jgi:hypothetical protein
MLMAGALAIYATTDVAFMAPPPQRPARKAKSGGPIQRAIAWLNEIASELDELPWVPPVTRRYPY